MSEKVAFVAIHGVGAPRCDQTVSRLMQLLAPEATRAELDLSLGTLPQASSTDSADAVLIAAQLSEFTPSGTGKHYKTCKLHAQDLFGRDVDAYEMYWGDFSTKRHPLKAIRYAIGFCFRFLSIGFLAADTASMQLPRQWVWRVYAFLLRLAAHTALVGGLFATALLLIVTTARYPLRLPPAWQHPVGDLAATLIAGTLVYLISGLLPSRLLPSRLARGLLAAAIAIAAWALCRHVFVHAVPVACGAVEMVLPARWADRLSPEHLLAFDWVFGWELVILSIAMALVSASYRSPSKPQRLWSWATRLAMIAMASAVSFYFVHNVRVHYGEHALCGQPDGIGGVLFAFAKAAAGDMEPSGIAEAIRNVSDLIKIGYVELSWLCNIPLILCALVLGLISAAAFKGVHRRTALRTLWTFQVCLTSIFLVSEWMIALAIHIIMSNRGRALFKIPDQGFDLSFFDGSYIGLPAACLLVLSVFSLIAAFTLLPSAGFEVRPPSRPEFSRAAFFGKWLTAGIQTARILLYAALPVAAFLQFFVLIGSGKLNSMTHAINADVWKFLGTMSLSIFAILLLTGGSVAGPLFGIAGDVEMYLRTTPMEETPKALIFQRFGALLAELETQAYSRIVFVCHSQGTVITADFLRLLQRSGHRFSCPVSLITMGSPLRQLYSILLPALYNWLDDPKLRASLGVERWTNLYASSDYIGRGLWRRGCDAAYGPEVFHKDGLEEQCLGVGAHTHYWRHPVLVETLADHLASQPS